MTNTYSEGGVSPSPGRARLHRGVVRAALAGCLSVTATTGSCSSDAVDDAPEVEDGRKVGELVSLPPPVAYWKYDDACSSTTVTDSSGNAAHGTKLNGAGCQTDGRIESAGSFDGVDDRVEVADRAAFHFTTAMTVAAWVKPSRLAGPQTIVNKWYAPDSYILMLQDGFYRFGVAIANGPTISIAAPAAVNRWAHVAGVFNGSTIALYVDGVVQATAAAAGGLQSSGRPIEMGNHPSWNSYAGLIDEVRLYNVALSASQVQQLGQEVWPNAVSPANSDPWLPQHHDQIRVLRPTVLALNFDNTKTMAQMAASLGQLASAFKEGSRNHGYADAAAPAMLQYSFIDVDLRDPVNPPSPGYPYRNSTKYPRENPAQEQWSFDYAQLFGSQFAQYYNIHAPDGHAMNLCELVNAGIVNEVWVYGNGDVPDANAAEVLEMKPRYDANRVRIAGALDRCAGNGCFDQEDINAIPASCTRAIKVGWVNSGRGPGCYMESIGHGIESFGNAGLIPYFTSYWKSFAGFDLDTRYGLGFPSWYSCAYGNTTCLRYTPCAHDEHEQGAALPSSCSACAAAVVSAIPHCGSTIWDAACAGQAASSCGPSSYVAYSTAAGSGVINNYDPVCQNAHFAPNSRGQYDDLSPAVVSSSCEHFRMLDGPGGTSDLKVPFNTAKFSGYQSIAPDCSGDWKVFWYQSFPGYQNQAKASGGAAMLPWWPFLYY